jgi:hypothetical protein
MAWSLNKQRGNFIIIIIIVINYLCITDMLYDFLQTDP